MEDTKLEPDCCNVAAEALESIRLDTDAQTRRGLVDFSTFETNVEVEVTCALPSAKDMCASEGGSTFVSINQYKEEVRRQLTEKLGTDVDMSELFMKDAALKDFTCSAQLPIGVRVLADRYNIATNRVEPATLFDTKVKHFTASSIGASGDESKDNMAEFHCVTRATNNGTPTTYTLMDHSDALNRPIVSRFAMHNLMGTARNVRNTRSHDPKKAADMESVVTADNVPNTVYKEATVIGEFVKSMASNEFVGDRMKSAQYIVGADNQSGSTGMAIIRTAFKKALEDHGLERNSIDDQMCLEFCVPGSSADREALLAVAQSKMAEGTEDAPVLVQARFSATFIPMGSKLAGVDGSA